MAVEPTPGVASATSGSGSGSGSISDRPAMRRPRARRRCRHRGCTCPRARHRWRTTCASRSIRTERHSPAPSRSACDSIARAITCGCTPIRSRSTTRIWDDGELRVVTVPAADRMVALSFGKTIQPREVTLRLAFTGATLHDEEGLFRQKDGDRWYLFSQGESEFARRITPCFDEPRWKTPWRVTVVAPKSDVAAGNMPIAHDQPLADGRHEVAFAETPPMASYLLAIAVGPFAIVDAGKVGKRALSGARADVPAPRERGRRRRAPDRAAGRIARGLHGDPDAVSEARHRDRAAPVRRDGEPRPDHVRRGHRVRRRPSPRRDRRARARASVVRQLRHAGVVGRSVARRRRSRAGSASGRGAERGPSAVGAPRRVHARECARRRRRSRRATARIARSHLDPENAFDSIAYDKGEAVLAMFERWVGADVFRAALRAYLPTTRAARSTTADLVAALAASRQAPNAQALAAYVDHAGAPIVELALACEPEHGATLTAKARDHLRIPVSRLVGRQTATDLRARRRFDSDRRSARRARAG